MHMGRSVEKDGGALIVSEETTSVSGLKVECVKIRSHCEKAAFTCRGAEQPER